MDSPEIGLTQNSSAEYPRNIKNGLQQDASALFENEAISNRIQGKIGTAMATLTYLTTTHFDVGALQKLPSELDKAGISKLFIATDTGVRAAGLVDKVTGALAADVPISIFDETPATRPKPQ